MYTDLTKRTPEYKVWLLSFFWYRVHLQESNKKCCHPCQKETQEGLSSVDWV